MSGADLLTIGALALGGFFFLAGTVGLLRFPDLHTRLHALAKADNLGLGLVVLGLVLQANGVAEALKLLGVWLLALLGATISCYLIAQYGLLRGNGGRDS